MQEKPTPTVVRKPPEWLPRFEPRGNRKEDFYDVLKVGMVVSLFVQLPNLSFFTIAAKLLTARGGAPEAGLEEGAVLLQVIALTLPLTAAAMAFGMLLINDVFKEEWHAVVVAAILLAGSMWLGNQLAAWGPLEPHTFGLPNPLLPDEAVSIAPTEPSWNPAVRIMQSLLGYFAAFGFWPFLHSLVVGFFLAWAISGKLYPPAGVQSKVKPINPANDNNASG
jgi:hypothetical protein